MFYNWQHCLRSPRGEASFTISNGLIYASNGRPVYRIDGDWVSTSEQSSVLLPTKRPALKPPPTSAAIEDGFSPAGRLPMVADCDLLWQHALKY